MGFTSFGISDGRTRHLAIRSRGALTPTPRSGSIPFIGTVSMTHDTGHFDRLIANALCLLMISYGVIVLMYSAIELEAPMMYIFLPAITSCGIAAAIRAAATHRPMWGDIRSGLLLGFVVYLSLFLSNVLFSKPLQSEYTVTEVGSGRGSSVYWRIDTPDRKGVQLFVHRPGATIDSNPKDVPLSLRRGWLGYYFGNRS